MDVVRSKDGTLIAFQKSGTGAPLVLVHGTSADHTRWATVLLPLAGRFTVYAMDRRGRGGSGDTDPYVIEREFEDVVAVLDSLDEPVNLLGHSYGAICALEAAARSKNLRRLILYEPPIPTGVDIYSPAVVNTMRDMLAGGDRDGVVATFMREVPRVPPHELELLRSSPAWQGRVAAAHTFLPRTRRFPGVIAIYHFARPDQGDEKTIAIWESAEALKTYRESDLVKEAVAFEKKMGLPSTREAYPLINAW